ncbi:hypothetical protein NADFUDRAFT_83280 [Nadsonia fulvescens var. elongata DSM 6958]|uniref:DM2 domain-containing protein n=1 Tax=Nadsonia fulvescens var. elongata DSM 6958 TaxID=857566 RepID=A0A1E3PIK7_9ASCO|nr:hypothetical protein NADFUDRAFT_83280 [Nadsonia fulvescens var. elongata DSM 6958]
MYQRTQNNPSGTSNRNGRLNGIGGGVPVGVGGGGIGGSANINSLNMDCPPPPPPASGYIARKPTNKNLSHKFDEIIPEAKLYRSLQETERKLDATISRKKLDLQDISAQKIKKTEFLRVFVSNTCTDQPWQFTLPEDVSTSTFEFDTSNAAWNLRIEGRLVNDEPADSPERKKFSTFFTSVAVELNPTEGETFEGGNIVEWHESTADIPANQDFDVLDIKRKGLNNVPCKIILQPKEYPNKFQLSAELASLLGIQEDTKAGVILAIWQYVKFYKLQDNSDKGLIKCNDALKAVFQADTISFPLIVDHIQPHLHQRPPIVLDYVIRTDIENTLGETAFDIVVEIDDPVQEQMAEMLSNWHNDQPEIIAIDDQIALTIQSLNNSRLRREFFYQLSSNPAEFCKKWIASQARDLKVISGDKGFNEEEVRRSDFYSDEFLSESIHMLLNTRR